MLVTAGATDVTTYFHLRLSATGLDATGLTITNIDLQYTRSRETPAAKVDATALGAANSVHSDNTAFEIDSTDQPGVYRVDWPDAAFASGVDEVILTVKVATAFTESLRVRLMSATRGLVGTALPNAAADAAGGLPISDAGGLDLDAQIGTDIDAILVDTAEIGAAGAGLTNINLPNQTMDIVGSITGSLSGSVGSVTGSVGSVTGAVGSVTAGVTLANDAITAAKFDETTAFPLKSDDSGSTQVARTGADADTLETLSDQVDTIATPAQVNAEVLDVLNTDTFAEPGQEAPPATTTLVRKLGWLYKVFRNKVTQDATTLKIFADDAATVDAKATVSDSGTEYTRGEIESGP